LHRLLEAEKVEGGEGRRRGRQRHQNEHQNAQRARHRDVLRQTPIATRLSVADRGSDAYRRPEGFRADDGRDRPPPFGVVRDRHQPTTNRSRLTSAAPKSVPKTPPKNQPDEGEAENRLPRASATL